MNIYQCTSFLCDTDNLVSVNSLMPGDVVCFQISISNEVKHILSLPSDERSSEQVQTVSVHFEFKSFWRLMNDKHITFHS